MNRETNILNNIDWLTIMIYLALVIIGWFNIYASVYQGGASMNIFDLSLNSGKQLIWIGVSLVLFIVIMGIDYKFYESVSYIIYGTALVVLLMVLIYGRVVSGAKSWFAIGSFLRFQPSEFVKFATALAVAKFIDRPGFKLTGFTSYLGVAGLVALPAMLIILQPDLGTAIVFASFIILLYREGLSPYFIMIGAALLLIFILTLYFNKIYILLTIGIFTMIAIGFSYRNVQRIFALVIVGLLTAGIVLSVDFVLNDVLKPHQRRRVQVLINPDYDPLGDGWNVTQSKIAIGSGGFYGKGFLQGTQTKFDFVPEQSTDFIFCTLGEEHGWIGSLIIIGLFTVLILRIFIIAERQKSRFARNYGYAAGGIIFMHFMINIGMTIGLFPVIGIPLPFLSYGGSSLIGFSLLLFVLVKLDAHRMQMLGR
jgi:rod shape determining protein RodA